MDNNKYYIPNAEDFNIGVECQVYYPREEVWKDREIRHSEDLNEILSRFMVDNTSVRFKYLDEDDILDCGFQYHNSGLDFIKVYSKHIIRIRLRKGLNQVSIFKRYKNSEAELREFCGKIKNKNEFQRLLKQLEIDAL